MSGPRRHRPTSLHVGRPTSLVASLRRRRPRAEGLRTGRGDGPLEPVDAADPAAQRAIEAARKLVDGAGDGQNRPV